MRTNKLYTKEEAASLEKVLDMGFSVENSNGDKINYAIDGYHISFHNGNEKDYSTVKGAFTQFFKKH
jgi:hypothetical protein